MEGVRGAVSATVKRVLIVADIVAFGTFHLACAAKEFAESGLGIPNQVLNLTSLSVAGCAIAGHASLGFDMGAKVFGKKECVTCNGWEGIRCTSCRGTGEVQFCIVNPGLGRGESFTAENVARAVVDGRAELQTVPGSMNFGLSLPSKQCTMCAGTGVVKCSECNGHAWKPGFTMEKLVSTPTRDLKALKKMDSTSEELKDTLENAATAEFLLFTRPELEGGLRFDDDVKKEMWWNYEEWKRKRLAHKAVIRKERGWETAQQVLVNSDPIGTLEDPAVLKNIPYSKARKAVEAEVQNLVVPPRPDEWTMPIKYPIKETDWTEVESKDSKRKEEGDILVKAQGSDALDAAWEKEWRSLKAEELTRQKIESYIKTLSTPKLKPEKTVPAAKTGAAPAKAAAKAQPAQMSKEEKKKKERKERAERLAKQAADREAALKKSKKK